MAQRDKLDLRGTVIDNELTETDQPFPHIDTIRMVSNVPRDFSAGDRLKLERAAAMYPVKASFRPETTVTAEFRYATEAAMASKLQSHGYHQCLSGEAP